MQHIKEIISWKKRQIAGKRITCRRCKGEAVIILNEHRFYVQCATCNFYGLLKTYNLGENDLNALE